MDTGLMDDTIKAEAEVEAKEKIKIILNLKCVG